MTPIDQRAGELYKESRKFDGGVEVWDKKKQEFIPCTWDDEDEKIKNFIRFLARHTLVKELEAELKGLRIGYVLPASTYSEMHAYLESQIRGLRDNL